MKIQVGWEPSSDETKKAQSSAKTIVTSKEIQQKQKSSLKPIDSVTANTVDSTFAINAKVRFSHIGPAAFDLWLRPELEALDASIEYNDESSSGQAIVPVDNEEAAREVITAWSVLEEN